MVYGAKRKPIIEPNNPGGPLNPGGALNPGGKRAKDKEVSL